MLITSFLSESQGQRCHGVSLPQWPLHLRAVRVVPGTATGRQEVEMRFGIVWLELWQSCTSAAKLPKANLIYSRLILSPLLSQTHRLQPTLETSKYCVAACIRNQPGATTTPSKIVASTWLGKVGCLTTRMTMKAFMGRLFPTV